MDDTQQIPIDARIYVCGQKSIIKSGDNFTCTKPTDQTYERRAGDAWGYSICLQNFHPFQANWVNINILYPVQLFSSLSLFYRQPKSNKFFYSH